MKSRKGFTLIELMVVVVIVAVLAAIVIPLLLSRVEKAKYSEGKAIASQIATAVRTYAVEAENPVGAPRLVEELGFRAAELNAKHFSQGGMSVAGVVVNANGTMDYTITCVPDIGEGLTHGNVILECKGNVSNFISPVGL